MRESVQRGAPFWLVNQRYGRLVARHNEADRVLNIRAFASGRLSKPITIYAQATERLSVIDTASSLTTKPAAVELVDVCRVVHACGNVVGPKRHSTHDAAAG